MTIRNTQDDPALNDFIELVSEITRDFTAHTEFPEFRVPHRFTPVDPLSDYAELDAGLEPHAISTSLFLMEWHSGPGFSSFWQLHALAVPEGRVYWVDGADGRHIVATGPADAERAFLQALFASNGEAFGTGIIDSAPSRICTTVRPRDFLIDLFISAFDRSANGWNAIDRTSRRAVRRWLKAVLQ